MIKMILKVIITFLGILLITNNVIGVTVVTNSKLIVSSIKSAPFLMDSKTAEDGEMEGFIMDLTKELCFRMGEHCEIKLVKDGMYGLMQKMEDNKKSVGNWTGMVEEILRGECDMAIADLSMNSDRGKVIDFSVPFLSSRLSIVHKMMSASSEDDEMSIKDILAILRPMQPMVWVTFLIVVLMYLGLMSAVEMKFHQEQSGNEIPLLKMEMIQYPRSTGGKFMSTIFLVWLVIWTSIYIASLTSQRVINSVHSKTDINNHKFTTIEEIVSDPNMIIGYVDSGSTAMFFKKTKTPLYNKIHQNAMTHQSLTKSVNEGISKVLDDESGNFAFVMESLNAEYVIKQNSDLYMIPQKFGPSRHFGVAMKKNHPIMEKVNEHILTMDDEGKIEDMFNKWWNMNSNNLLQSAPPTRVKLSNESHEGVTMKEVSSLYLLGVCGMLVGVGLVIFETRRNK